MVTKAAKAISQRVSSEVASMAENATQAAKRLVVGRERMSAVDTAWLRMDSNRNLMMIVGVDVFEKPVSYEAIATLITERLLKFKRFRQKVETDASGSWWVMEKNFQLGQHLVHHTLKARAGSGKGAGPAGEAEMQEFVGTLASQPLDPEFPLWQFHLVENYKGTNALVVRIHHCIADGIALVAVMMSLTDQNNGAQVQPSRRAKDVDSNPWTPFLKPLTKGTIKAISATGSAWSKSIELMAQPDRLVDYAQIGSQVLKDAAKIALMPNDSQTSLKGVPQGSKRVAWNDPRPLVEVKLICKALDASVNDVLLSCVAGSIRQYLIARGESVDGVELRAMVPVNLRPIEQALKLGNRFGLVPLTLPVGVADPIERVREVRRRMEGLKGGYQALLAFAVLGVVGLTPKVVQTQVLDLLARKATAVMTNVPGPAMPIYMAGGRLSRVMFWVPQSGDIGVGVSILSYDGGVQFGLITDSALCDDPQTIIDGFAPEFDKLIMTLSMMPEAMWNDPELSDSARHGALFPMPSGDSGKEPVRKSAPKQTRRRQTA
jgi:diacylglycerol O-acyltransferase / wax synthase